MTNIIISGANGRMGKTIAVVAGIDASGATVDSFPVYREFSQIPDSFNLSKVDCIIDFSNPSLLRSLTEFAMENNIPLVIATTGYSQDQIEYIKQVALRIPLFFTANMSLGVNVLAELCKKAISILGDDYDVEIIEKHHNQKIDAPSGTALLLANEINDAADERYHYVYDRTQVRRKRDKTEIGIHAVRGGTIVGEHDVIFAGDNEVITLSHSAGSRKVFATGAVRAAEFLSKQPAGLYSMKDVVKID